MTAWFDKYYETIIASGYYQLLIDGLVNTLVITLGALVIGVVIGTLIAVIKYFADDVPVLKPFAIICDVYTTVIRGIPVVVLLLIFFFVIFASADDGVLVATLTFGINSGAYMAELIRSGINAVDKGQMEAGRSLGMSKMQTMARIIFPQAIRYILPAIGNEMIALLKETSVAGYVGVTDLTKAGNTIAGRTFSYFIPLISVAVIYLVLVIILSWFVGRLERRLRRSEH